MPSPLSFLWFKVVLLFPGTVKEVILNNGYFLYKRRYPWKKRNVSCFLSFLHLLFLKITLCQRNMFWGGTICYPSAHMALLGAEEFLLHTIVIGRCLGLHDTEQQREGIYSEALVAFVIYLKHAEESHCTWPFYIRDGLEHLQILAWRVSWKPMPWQILRDDCL